MQLSLGTSGEFIVRSEALPPSAIDVGKSNAHIERIVANLDLLPFHRGISHGFTPVVQIVHPDPEPGTTFAVPFLIDGVAAIENVSL